MLELKKLKNKNAGAMLLRKSENKGYAARIYYARYHSKLLAWIISFIILLIQSCNQKTDPIK